ncbi:MAG TPA: hypothetical protein VN456_16080, partial [Desulfosporosinus sp.]|nr:hypothetical protein [Desulfosporosinus sp.]
ARSPTAPSTSIPSTNITTGAGRGPYRKAAESATISTDRGRSMRCMGLSDCVGDEFFDDLRAK